MDYVHVTWEPYDAGYIRTRSQRYPDALDIDVVWADEAMADSRLLHIEPDPKSLRGDARLIGYSAGAGRVLVIIATRGEDGELYGVNAWPATGADRREYERRARDGDQQGTP